MGVYGLASGLVHIVVKCTFVGAVLEATHEAGERELIIKLKVLMEGSINAIKIVLACNDVTYKYHFLLKFDNGLARNADLVCVGAKPWVALRR